MASKSRVDDNLFFSIWLCELYEENFGREIIDVPNSERHQSIGELMGNDLEQLGFADVSHAVAILPLHLKTRIFASWCCCGSLGMMIVG